MPCGERGVARPHLPGTKGSWRARMLATGVTALTVSAIALGFASGGSPATNVTSGLPLAPDGTEPPPGIVQNVPGDSTAPNIAVGPGVAVGDALTSGLAWPLLVNGFIVIRDGAVSLCSLLAESLPSLCGGDFVSVQGLDPTAIPLQHAGASSGPTIWCKSSARWSTARSSSMG